MRYSVYWGHKAEVGFMTSMLRAVDKPALWKVAHAINNMLADHPSTASESREVDWRILFVRPYSVLYSVDEMSRTVHVEQIKWVGS